MEFRPVLTAVVVAVLGWSMAGCSSSTTPVTVRDDSARPSAITRAASTRAGSTVTLIAQPGPSAAHQRKPRIAFTRQAIPGEGQPTLWTGNADGTGFRPVGDRVGSFPDWSPDRSRLLFDYVDDNGGAQIATVRPDGTGFRQLTDTTYNEAADYSPDGRRIVFDRAPVPESHPDFATRLWVMNADGRDAHPLLRQRQAGFDYEGEYSPDGSRITFVRYDPTTDKSAIHVVAAHGGKPRRITPWDTYVEHPRWSVDGHTVIYNIEYGADLDDPRNGIWTVRVHGGRPRLLLPGGALHPFKPDYSPDGTKILFGCLVRGATDELCVMNADGTDVTRLTTTDAFENHPVWD